MRNVRSREKAGNFDTLRAVYIYKQLLKSERSKMSDLYQPPPVCDPAAEEAYGAPP